MTPAATVTKILTMAALLVLAVTYVAAPAATLASPPALPPCGDNSVSGSSNSRSPDIALSENSQYTAAVWIEGGSTGNVKLAYADIATTNHRWLADNVVASGNYVAASVAFDPQQNNRVHIAFQSNSSAIGYARCDLGGGCTVSTSVATGGANPHIVAANEGVVIVYQAGSAVRYVHLADSLPITPRGPFTLDNNAANPAVAYSSNKIHLAFYSPSEILYRSLNPANIGVSGDQLSPSSEIQLGLTPATNSGIGPAFTAIAAKNNRVMVVWDHYRAPVAGDANLSTYRLAQNYSLDNGATWNINNPRSIPANVTNLFSPTEIGNDDLWTSYDQSAVTTFGPFLRLQPDVTLSQEGSTYYAHVVWHAEMTNVPAEGPILQPGDKDSGDRGDNGHDILYAYAPLPTTADTNLNWTGVPIGNDGAVNAGRVNPNGRTGALYSSTNGLSDLTAWYFLSSTQQSSNGLGRDTIQPAAVFIDDNHSFTSGHQNRLQVVYLSQSATDSQSYQVRYNGFELGVNNMPPNPDPTATNQDSDCDSKLDWEEIQIPADPTDPDETLFCDGSTINYYDEMNCDRAADNGGDAIPDYLDIDTDGDTVLDYYDANWRTFDRDCCIYMPIITKS